MGKSKVIFGGQVLIDLTGDSVKPSNLLKGYTAHGADGEPIEGECEYDANTAGANATASEILQGKTAYIKGAKVTGAMRNRGAVEGEIDDINGEYIIEQGYHDGSGRASIKASERMKLVPDNIREGITVLGVTGKMSGSEDVKAQSKTVTPTTAEQTVLPDSGYNALTSVTVLAIPYAEIENEAGGVTVTIG